MKKILFLLIIIGSLTSCVGTKNTISKPTRERVALNTKPPKTDKVLNNVIETAKKFEGTRYKYGGTTRKGMDCSGLVFTAFKAENIQLPRVSRDMATRGKRISLNKIDKGDLVFFQTNKNRKVINHVGLVVETNDGSIQFIHATTSRGVIVSSLNENYWKKAYVEARRIL